jgi:recombination protein RecT
VTDQEVERYRPPATVQKTLADPRFKAELEKALPPQLTADEVIRVVRTEVMASDNLQKCTPDSFMRAMLRSAAVGLRPGILGEAFLIPRWNNRASAYEATFQAGAQGLAKLARNTGVQVPHGVVWPGDQFDWQLGTQPWVHHKPDLENDHADQANIVAFWAASTDAATGRIYDIVVMNHAQMLAWRERYAGRNKDGAINEIWLYPGKGSGRSPKGQFEEMGVKTIIMRALKWAPKSPELETVTRGWQDAEPAGPIIDDDGLDRPQLEARSRAVPQFRITRKQLSELGDEMERTGATLDTVNEWLDRHDFPEVTMTSEVMREAVPDLLAMLRKQPAKATPHLGDPPAQAPAPESTHSSEPANEPTSEEEQPEPAAEVVDGEGFEVTEPDETDEGAALSEAERSMRKIILSSVESGPVPELKWRSKLESYGRKTIFGLEPAQLDEFANWYDHERRAAK